MYACVCTNGCVACLWMLGSAHKPKSYRDPPTLNSRSVGGQESVRLQALKLWHIIHKYKGFFRAPLQPSIIRGDVEQRRLDSTLNTCRHRLVLLSTPLKK
jgi:hypothetical protein